MKDCSSLKIIHLKRLSSLKYVRDLINALFRFLLPYKFVEMTVLCKLSYNYLGKIRYYMSKYQTFIRIIRFIIL